MAASSAKKTSPRKKTSLLPSPTAVAPTTVSGFRSNRPNHLLTLPSGNTIEVRRPGIQEFMKSGLIPDSLQPIVNEQIAQGKRQSPAQRAAAERKLQEALQQAVQDPKTIDNMLRAMQRIAAASWIAPKLAFHEREETPGLWVVIPAHERDTETYLYTDELDLEDIEFTFTFVSGGTGDLERFRQQAGTSVASVRNGPDLEMPPK